MVTGLTLAIGVAIIVGALAGFAVIAGHERYEQRARRRVSVHLQRPLVDGGPMTIEGIIVSRSGGRIHLAMAALLREGDADGSVSRVTLDAERVEIEQDRVLFVEVFRA